jgi:hypothetical protein
MLDYGFLTTFHILRCSQRCYASVGCSDYNLIGILLPQISDCENAGDVCLAFFISNNQGRMAKALAGAPVPPLIDIGIT